MVTDRQVIEAAALWAAGLIYVDARGSYRWTHSIAGGKDRRGHDLPPLAAGAVRSRVIPQNKAVRRNLAAKNAAGASLHEIAKQLDFLDNETARAAVLFDKRAHTKRERQFKHVLASELEAGKPKKVATRIAAAVTNKSRAKAAKTGKGLKLVGDGGSRRQWYPGKVGRATSGAKAKRK